MMEESKDSCLDDPKPLGDLGKSLFMLTKASDELKARFRKISVSRDDDDETATKQQ